MSGAWLMTLALVGGLAAARGLNSERPLMPVERVGLSWWLGIIFTLLAGELLGPGPIADATAGVLFTSLGAFIALNVSSVADHLATRRVGLISRKTHSVAWWRWYGVFLIPVGILWAAGVFTAS